MYLALYRKYRPKKFEDVIGQDHIIKTLVNQIAMDKVGHAYLFCGSRGTGKTSTAKIFAKEVNCTCGSKGECLFCKGGNSLDILEIDAASNNSVDEIRDLREKVKYPPVDGKYRVYIIDEVHMLSPSAFNALLKTLEEPPKHAIFILATTEVHKLPATILSRCMRFDFKLVSVEDLTKLLTSILQKENVEYEDNAISLIARAGDGSVRDTLSIADRCISYSGKLTTAAVVEVLGNTERQTLIDIAGSILCGNLTEVIFKLDKILSSGKSPAVLSKDLVYYFRDLLIISTVKEKSKALVLASAEDFAAMQEQAVTQNYTKITKAIELLSSIEADLRYSTSPRIVLENCLIKMLCRESLEERLEKLEKLLGSETTLKSNIVQNNGGSVETKKTDLFKNENVNSGLTNSNIAENLTTDNKVAEKQTLPTVSSNDKLLGDLLETVRQQKLMSLLMACRQIYKLAVEEKTVKLYIKDQASISMLNTEKYGKILTEYFETYGLKWQIVTTSGGGNIDDLSLKLGGKLQIK